MTELPQIGSCRCGTLQLEVSKPPMMTAACHCRGCQKMSASAFSLTMMVPPDGVRLIAGEAVKGGIKGPQLDHYMCPECGTWMFTRISGVDAFVNVRPILFDVPEWCLPFIETMTGEKLDWAQTPARHSYDGFPPETDFPMLRQDFARR
ncbi:GFA family protein [Alloyangia pacifica]|uniref:GFA family protein n=1 Tax=Alloyangia pacifica TaxID=311180 RepID=UPI001CFF038E|nr:GFA family protein [Alloyangia pacifica]